MAPPKVPDEKNAASKTFLKRDAEKHGLGAPTAPTHKEGHAPGQVPVATDSGVTDVDVGAVSTTNLEEKATGASR